MPIYDFEDVETGEHLEVLMGCDRAPDFGEVRKVGGRTLRRLVTAPPAMKVHQGFTSMQPARWHPDAPRHDAKGRAVFATRNEAKEFARKHADRSAHQNYEVE